MHLTEFKKQLCVEPAKNVTIVLPDGTSLPAHFHVTEVGHVVKKFVDCGGTFRTTETCVLQTWWGSPRDDGHRLNAGKLAHVLDLARPILPADENIPVEIECEQGVVSQFPVAAVVAGKDSLTLQLGLKHTDCLAREKCGAGDEDEDEADARCCASIHEGGGSCCG